MILQLHKKIDSSYNNMSKIRIEMFNQILLTLYKNCSTLIGINQVNKNYRLSKSLKQEFNKMLQQRDMVHQESNFIEIKQIKAQ